MKIQHFLIPFAFLIFVSQSSLAHFGHEHEEGGSESFLSSIGYGVATTFNVAELYSHLKVLKDFWQETPTSKAEIGLLIWNAAEVYGHSMNALNYGNEIMQSAEQAHEDHDAHDHHHDESAQGYYVRLAAVNAATALFQGLTLHKYWQKESSPANKAVLLTTGMDFLFHSWDLYYSASKAVESQKK